MALTSKLENLTKKQDNNSSQKTSDKKESKTAKWKFERSISKTNTYEKNGKKYNWCDGPGHNGKGMWVFHKPGSCTSSNPKGSQGKGKEKTSFDKQTFINKMKAK